MPVLALSLGLPFVRRSSAFDPDAAAFFTAAGITDGTQMSAVNQLVLDLKGFSLWTPMIALYPFVGGTASTHSFCLKNPADHQITWQGTVTHDANGALSNGVGGSDGSTGIDPNAHLSNNSNAFGFYSRTDADLASADMTCSGGADFYQLDAKLSDVGYYDNSFNGGAGRITASMSGIPSTGLFVNSRTASNAQAAYRNGASIATGTGAPGTLPIGDLLVCVSARQFAFAFVSTGLDATQNANLYTAVQAYQTALGRNV